MKRNLTFKALVRSTSAQFAASTLALTAALSTGAAAQDGADTDEVQSDVIRVVSQFIPNEKRETSEITSLVGTDDFAISGDSDIASALKRVTGLSLSRDNKFIFARGLNERYTQATLNGSPLPSPEPLRRTVPLDIFPTAVLESALARKTFAPETSGEFGGAAIDLRTKAIPDARFFELGVSAGVNSKTTFNDGLLYDGGDFDWTGFDDGERNTPAAIAEVLNFNNASDEQKLSAIEEIANPSLVVLQSGPAGGEGGVSFAGGDRFDVNDWLSVGATVAGGYSNDWSTREGIRNVGSTRFSTQNSIGTNFLGTIGADLFDDHQIKGTVLAVRSTEKEARTIDSFIEDQDRGFVRSDSLEWFERQVWTTQIQGEHYFDNLGGLELAWRGSYSEGFRDAPYQFTAFYTRDDLDDEFRLSTAGVDSTQLQFSKVEDDSTDFGVDVNYPLALGPIGLEFKAGYAYTELDREALSRQFNINFTGDLVGLRVDQALANLDPNNFTESVGGGFPPAYIATLEVDAGYVGVDAELTENLLVSLGARYEESVQGVNSFLLVGDEPTVVDGRFLEPEGAIIDDYLLPAGTLQWTFGDFQLRLAASQSIIRPQFRELAPAIFNNTETDQSFFGNPFLKNSELTNLDARLEYYFGADEFVTAGVFYKEIDDPIEEFQSPTGNQTRTSFLNAPKAELYGFEAEFEKSFELQDWADWNLLQNRELLIKTNYTYTDSEVTASEGDIVTLSSIGLVVAPIEREALDIIDSGRRLQGQSDHIVNLILGVEDFDGRWRSNLVFNYQSERIREVGNLIVNRPDILEEVPTTLDFNFTKEFSVGTSDLEFGFQATNLLDSEYEAFREEINAGDGTVTVLPIDTYEFGQTYSFNLKLRY